MHMLPRPVTVPNPNPQAQLQAWPNQKQQWALKGLGGLWEGQGCVGVRGGHEEGVREGWEVDMHGRMPDHHDGALVLLHCCWQPAGLQLQC